jgi:hypothetical protein
MMIIFKFYMVSNVSGLVLGILVIAFILYPSFFIIKIPADLLSWSQPCSIVNNQKTGFIPLWLTVFFLASVLGWAFHPLR